jgi:16S rRNA (cytosine967-C5)-methyltransferase
MKKGKPRDLALSVLNSDDGRPSKPEWSLSERWDAFPWADDRDRSFAMNLVQGVRRWRLRLDWIVRRCLDFPFTKLDPPVLNILRLALYQILFMSRVPHSAAVDEAVRQTRMISKKPHLTGFVNAILRRVCREAETLALPPTKSGSVEELAVFYSFPEWMVHMLLAEMGREETMRLLDASNQVPKAVCRANILKAGRDEVIRCLRDEGVAPQAATFSPQGVVLEGLKGPPDRLKAFSKGMFQIQGEAAQICSYLLAPEKGDVILDVCAGLGGKSTHLAELTDDMARIVSLDQSIERLKLLNASARRLGISSIEAVAGDASAPLDRLFNFLFDKILLDAPCSGLGVINRHPEIKWRRTEADIKRHAQLQLRMLSSSASLLKKGGKILYATCTVTREENDSVVKEFLRMHPEMALVSLKEEAPGWVKGLIDGDGFFRTYPHKHQMEGFFAALMLKKP